MRAAVQVANAYPGSTITIPAGHYKITIAPDPAKLQGFADRPESGVFAITAPTTIAGAGQDRTIVDGNQLDSVFTNAATTTISGMTITGGVAKQQVIPNYDTGGGGIANTGDLSLREVTITGNYADYGGGIFNVPGSNLHVEDSSISGNSSEEAGGVRCDETCTFLRTTIADNHVDNPDKWYRPGGFAGMGGGIDIRGVSPVTLIDSVVTGNTAASGGGGINIAPAYLDSLPTAFTDVVNPPWGQLVLQGSTITRNTVGGVVQNCKKVFARIVSDGSNTVDDATCS